MAGLDCTLTGASPLLGLEAAGTIMEVGAEAAGDFKPGERVMALCNGGTYAEQVLTLDTPVLLECGHLCDARCSISMCPVAEMHSNGVYER